MEHQPFFNLEAELERWTQMLISTGRFSQDNVDELESHLLDQTEELQLAGLAADEAFYIALKRIGKVEVLKEEFTKVNALSLYRSRLMLLLNGIVLFFLLKVGAEVGNLLLALAGHQLQWSEEVLLYVDGGVKAGVFLLMLSALLVLLRGRLKANQLLQYILFPKPIMAAVLVALAVLSQLGVWYVSPLVRHEIGRDFLFDLNRNAVFFSIYFFVAVAAALLYLSVKNRKARPAIA